MSSRLHPLVPALFLILACGVDGQSPPVPKPATTAAPTSAQPAGNPAEKSPAGESTPPARNWTVDDLVPYVADLGQGHDFKRGGRTFQNAGCGLCHAFGGYFQGSGFAPDLTSAFTKFSTDVLVQSVIEPSATVNGQFYATLFRLKSGRTIQGVIVEETDDGYKVAPALSNIEATVTIKAADIASKEPSKVSPMPPGLLNPFSLDEVLDLFAFLQSRGDPDAPIFQKEPSNK